MRHAMVGLWLTACTVSTPPTTDTVDSAVDSVDITDSGDSAGPQDTFNGATGWVDDSDTDIAVDTDLDSGLLDTGGCKFGEIADCNGECFPTYFKGDGYCDDGDPLPADFDCVDHQFDRGDCEVDTDDTDLQRPGCDYVLRFDVRTWSNEIFWRIEDGAGNVVASISPGDYPSNDRVYEHPLTLVDGTYTFFGGDTFGDGWHGGSWSLVDSTTGHKVAEGLGFSSGSSRQWTFSPECQVGGGCPLDLTTLAGPEGDEIGWELYASGGLIKGELVPGSAAANTTDTQTITAYEGTYTLRLRDIQVDGWEGGRLELRHANGYLVGATAMPPNASAWTYSFPFDCAPTAQPPVDDPGAPLEISDCDTVPFQMLTLSGGREIGFEVYRASDWRQLRSKQPNSFTDNDDDVSMVALQDGLHFLSLIDNGNDGWEGGKLRINDPTSSATLLEVTLAGGARGGKYFIAECAEPIDTDTDTDAGHTDLPVDTGTTCLPDAEKDCNRICAPTAYKGDGVCDDGGRFVFDFDCADHGFDDGDCLQPPAP